MQRRLRRSASCMSRWVRGTQIGQHVLLCVRHQKKIFSATSWMAFTREPRSIALQDCQLSHIKTSRCLVCRFVVFMHQRMPNSSRSVLLRCCSSHENSARNIPREGTRTPSCMCIMPPPVAVCEASWNRNETSWRLKRSGCQNACSIDMPMTSADIGALRLSKCTPDQNWSWRWAASVHLTVPVQNLFIMTANDKFCDRMLLRRPSERVLLWP